MNRLKRMVCALVVLTGAAWSFATPAVAQVANTGVIEVLVQDQAGLAVPGVTVVAQAADSVTKREGVTDDEGRAVLVGLAPSASYIVTTQLAGFTPARNENVLVRSGQTATVRDGAEGRRAHRAGAGHGATRRPSTSRQRDDRAGHHAAVDRVAADRPQLSELPAAGAGRAARTIRRQPGNPASKSGMNYSDIAGALGVSSDNFYYFNGINVTDPVTGTFGANLNTEIIQEQRVLTGGIPAEFVGTPGLLVERHHEDRHQRFRRLGELLLPERRPVRREQELLVTRSSAPSTRPARSAGRSSRTRPGSSAATGGSSGRTT